MAETVRAARPHELARMRMDENLTFFEDAMGSMERILRTPIPLRWGGGGCSGCAREGADSWAVLHDSAVACWMVGSCPARHPASSTPHASLCNY